MRSASAVSGTRQAAHRRLMNQEKIGSFLARCRQEKGMTQAQVAESVGVSHVAVSKWENGSSDPSTTNLLALAKLYGVPAEELLKEAE